MRIALIQPVTGTESTKVVRVVREPLGLLYLASAINNSNFLREYKSKSHSAKVFHPIERLDHGALVPWTDEFLIEKIRDFSADAVGISTMTYNFERGIEIATKIKNELGDIPVIFGGDHVSGCATAFLKWQGKPGGEAYLKDMTDVFISNCVDVVVVGEGEHTIVELLETMEGKRSLHEIKGIAYKVGDEIIISRRERISNLDTIPIPDRSDLDWNLYKSSVLGDNVATMHTSRGCRFTCAYCSTPSTWGKSVTKRSARNVVDEIEYLVNHYSISRITFADEDFLSDFQRLHEICDEIKRRHIKIRWDSFASIEDLLKDGAQELLFHLHSVGCYAFFVGIESLNRETLTDFHRPMIGKYTLDEYMVRIQKAIDAVNAADIEFCSDYMIGYPKENEDDLRKGFERLTRLRGMPYIYLPILAAFPGTHLYEECKRNNWLLPEKSFSSFNCSQQVLKCNSTDITSLRDELEIYYYTNERYLDEYVLSLKSHPERFDETLHLYDSLSNDYPENNKIKEIREIISSIEVLEIGSKSS